MAQNDTPRKALVLAGGRLGGVNRIKADYETDLEVTFVPSSLEPLYLKAYTGAAYTGDQWERNKK